MTNEQLIRAIQDALNTEETGEALVEVARNACRAEQELANIVARQRAALTSRKNPTKVAFTESNAKGA